MMTPSGYVPLLALMIASPLLPGPASPPITSVCELSQNYSRWNNKAVTVRGVYYYGLRQDCPHKCAGGLWPSFIDLIGGDWKALADAENRAETAAQAGKHLEVWVTVVGRLQTTVRPSRSGPCDVKSWHLPGYGHLGVFPTQIAVDRFTNIELKEHSQSPYDYGHMYHGPM